MRLLILLTLAAFGLSCSVEPEPLAYGKDACHHCKMVLMDQKFGAELVTTKGKVYKFDDINCMINFMHSEIKDDREIQFRLVTDFSQQGQLIDVGNAFYVKSSQIKSPMASQVAAFEDYEIMNQHKEDLMGIYLTWGELITQFK